MVHPGWHRQNVVVAKKCANLLLSLRLCGNLRVGVAEERCWRYVLQARLLVGLECNGSCPLLAAEREHGFRAVRQQCDIAQEEQIVLPADRRIVPGPVEPPAQPLAVLRQRFRRARQRRVQLDPFGGREFDAESVARVRQIRLYVRQRIDGKLREGLPHVSQVLLRGDDGGRNAPQARHDFLLPLGAERRRR